MRIIRVIFLSTLALAGLCSWPARAEVDLSQLYLVGEATASGWDNVIPDEMVPLGNDCFLWDGYLQAGDLKFINNIGSWDNSLVAPEYNLMFSEGVSYDLGFTPEGAPDHKFVNNRAGFVRIVVDLRNRRVNFRRPAVGLVGEAALGWLSITDIIPLFADDDGNLIWSGQLRSGELKMLADGAFDWAPCYNAKTAGEQFTAGCHTMVYNTSDKDAGGNYIDFKYVVPRAGLYTLTFHKDASSGRFNSVDVSMADEPNLDGTFGAPSGRYLAAIDRRVGRIHFGPVPQRLYIGTSGADCVELSPSADGGFSSIVNLKQGVRYKLSYDPANWNVCLLSPDKDVDMSAAPTSNVAPMDGGGYTVAADGEYLVTVGFSGSVPELSAERQTPAYAQIVDSDCAVRVKVIDRQIVVDGEYRDVAVYDVAGRNVGCTSPCWVTPGCYVVKVDNNVYKLSVR